MNTTEYRQWYVNLAPGLGDGLVSPGNKPLPESEAIVIAAWANFDWDLCRHIMSLGHNECYFCSVHFVMTSLSGNSLGICAGNSPVTDGLSFFLKGKEDMWSFDVTLRWCIFICYRWSREEVNKEDITYRWVSARKT